MLSALHSVVIEVRDLDVGLDNYARLLGRSPARIEIESLRGTRNGFFPLENMMLEVRAAGAPPTSSAGEEADAKDPGLVGLRLTAVASDPLAELNENQVEVASVCDLRATNEEGHDFRGWRSHRISARASRGLPVEIISQESWPSPFGNAPIITGPGGAAEIDPLACIHSLDHVVVMSPDPEATRDFYHARLGIRLALDRSFEERGVRLLFFRIGGTTIEIGGKLGAAVRSDHSDRFGGLAWKVYSIEAIADRLRGEDFDISEIRTGHKPGTRVCTVRHPVHRVPTLLIEPLRDGA